MTSSFRKILPRASDLGKERQGSMCEADVEALPIYKIPHSCLTAEYSRFLEAERVWYREAKRKQNHTT